jgi:arylsulfatase A-like enzyme
MNILPRAAALAALSLLPLAALLPAQDAAPVPTPAAAPTPHAEHVVVMVWDGLRPDSVTEEITPTLFKLAHDGVFFAHHHCVFPSSTEVNGTAMATGSYPGTSSILGNREYRPYIDPYRSVATEELESIRVGDKDNGTHGYVRCPTVAEILHGFHERTAVAGTKQVAVLQDRGQRPDAGSLAAENVDFFNGKTLPEEAIKELERVLGSSFPPDIRLPNVDEDGWTTRALTQALWKDELPKFSLLWMSDPDFTQHRYGPDSPQAHKALADDDANLATVLATLEQRGWRDSTDVFVVSDHGFSTIGRQIDVAKDLAAGGFDAVREFRAEPRKDQVLAVGLGGTVYLYVVGHDPATVGRLVEHLQRTEYAGVIFTHDSPKYDGETHLHGTLLPGTFPMSAIHIDSGQEPDVAVVLRWQDEKNANGFPGMMYSDGERRAGQGSHASLSRYEMHNTLVANGPSFQRGFRDELPSGNTDLAPTILHILHPDYSPRMNGRILREAFAHPDAAPSPAAPRIERLETGRAIDATAWKQYLQITHYAGVDYLDEGNTGTPLPASAPAIPPAPDTSPTR